MLLGAWRRRRASASYARTLVVVCALAAVGAVGLLTPTAAKAGACPAGQWLGTYYAGTTLSGAPVGTRCDAGVDFDWSGTGPGVGTLGTDNYSVTWTQTATFAAGTYTFTATADDGIRVTVDSTVVIDGWKDQGATTYTAAPALSSGSHTIKVDYYQKGGDAIARFGYSAAPPAPPTCATNQWTASYYNSVDLSGTPWVVCEAAIDHDWGTTGPQGVGVGSTNYSVSWTKTDTFNAGPLSVTATADDGIRVYVDGAKVVDAWVDEGPTTYTASPTVTAGSHTIKVEYYQKGGGAVARVSYVGAPRPPPTCTADQWTSAYYPDTDLSGPPVAQQCESAINDDWGETGPGVGGLGGSNFSVRWTKTATLDAGPLSITATADDGIRVYVDGTAVIDKWMDEGPTTYTASPTVTAGSHTIKVEYYQKGGGAVARVTYTGASTPPPTCNSIQWNASYYANTSLAGTPVAQRCESAVNDDWGEAGPGIGGLGGSNFSVRWSRTDTFKAGTTTVTVTADDGVRAYVDGAEVVDEWIAEGPTTYTAKVPVTAGTHTVTVEYFQGDGGALVRASYTGGGAVGALPPPPPGGCTSDCQGSWQVAPYQSTVRSIHASVLHTGNVLLVAGSGNNESNFDAGSFTSSVWNPTSGQFTNVPAPADLFCTGHVQLPDGRILLAGGTLAYPTPTTNYEGLAKSFIFDPTTNTYTATNDMTGGGHWYPTLVMRGDGTVFATGGLNEQGSGNVSTEMFDSATGAWKPLSQIPQTYFFWGLYPQMTLLSDGRLFYSGEHTFGNALPNTSGSELYDIDAAKITEVSGLRDINERDQGASVLLPPAQAQKVMDFGGGNSYSDADPTAHTDIIDLSTDNPTWTAGPDLPAAKMYVSAVILPDGKVLETGGGLHNRMDPVHEASMYDPVRNTFTSMPADPQDRMYHSEAFLLPDGRVAAIGNNPADGSFDLGISIYSPWYMTRTRPTITSAANSFGYGTAQPIGVTGDVRRITLIRPASVTHSDDANQRSVDLTVSGTGSTRTAVVPSNPNLLPPGYYMMFAQDGSGVPSVARWVRVA